MKKIEFSPILARRGILDLSKAYVLLCFIPYKSESGGEKEEEKEAKI
jgi:hypothetical protein